MSNLCLLCRTVHNMTKQQYKEFSVYDSYILLSVHAIVEAARYHFSPWRPEFSPCWLWMRFMVDRVAQKQIFLQVLYLLPANYYSSIARYSHVRCAVVFTEKHIIVRLVLSCRFYLWPGTLLVLVWGGLLFVCCVPWSGQATIYRHVLSTDLFSETSVYFKGNQNAYEGKYWSFFWWEQKIKWQHLHAVSNSCFGFLLWSLVNCRKKATWC